MTKVILTFDHYGKGHCLFDVKNGQLGTQNAISTSVKIKHKLR